MIFYFSATGNSLWVAKTLSERLSLPIVSITDAQKHHIYMYDVSQSRRILFVFPVHSWGPALPIVSFIRQLQLKGYTDQPIYAVCTCGDDCGLSNQAMRDLLQKKGWKLQGVYSVCMPNSYILLPGFDVDNKETEEYKLAHAPKRIEQIVAAIQDHKERKELYHAGSAAWLKTKLIYPLFMRYIQGKTSFYATNACIDCGLCERICPVDNIYLTEKGPLWGKQCVQCLACIHRCPKRAIEYGKITQTKGRYKNPLVYK